ncbi:MAG: serine/threonine protein kinase [Ktedonobacteraceae bacterium]
MQQPDAIRDKWRDIIDLQHGHSPKNAQTGRLERRTLLIKRYMIQRTIGHGGMGAVYLARDLRRQTNCAIKEMSLSMVPAEDRVKAVQNFKAEAKMLAGLNHPNLPTFSGFFTEGTRHFLVMEYVDGMTLDAFLEHNNGPFPERRVLAWAKQLCDVLAYLHSQHPPIIFRDMKPGNIMLMRNGRVKLIDFGIARFFRHTSSQDTQLLGTPGFAPPEQYGKAQTDERSDIYSLAMTLFQLLTNTLSEKGFGLQDVHAVNPSISLHVARTLEKATSLKPEDRFQTVEAFRRALLGEGTFVFENGEQAANPEELAELCVRFPEEAADYLFSGEIATWLEGIGETDLAGTTKAMCAAVHDPRAVVEQFIEAVLGPSIHIRTNTGKYKAMSKSSQSGIAAIVPSATAGVESSNRGRITRVPVVDIEVEPRVLDFGEVHPGLSEPLLLSITSNRGNVVRGTIAASAEWMVLDQASFSGVRTDVSVQIDATRLRGSMHYTGTIFVIPDEDDEEQDITVRVEVDVLGNISSFTRPSTKAPSRSALFEDEDDDEEDEEDDIPLARANGSMRMSPPSATNSSPPTNTRYSSEQYDEYTKKYGLYTGNTNASSRGWEPIQASPLQQRWLQRILTVFASFMIASLFYTVLARLPLLAHQSILSPNAWFIVVLLGIVVAAPIGALAVNWNRRWSVQETLSRLCTGLYTTLFPLGVSELLWQTFLHNKVPPLQLFVLLLLAALSSSVCTNASVSEKIIERFLFAMEYMRRPVMIAAVLVGGFLGFILAIGFPPSGFTLLGIAGGIGVALAFVLQLDRLLKQNN